MQRSVQGGSEGDRQGGENFGELVALMERLLAPDGCPWDREQTLKTLKPFVIEEAYEVLEAIDLDDVPGHCDELGDLLFQVVFQAALRAHAGQFGINDVVAAIVRKMVHRHPHVFGETTVRDSSEVLENWGKLKAAEHEKQGKKRRALDGVPAELPALLRAQRIGEKAAAVGFDWPDAAGVRDKIAEELREIDQAVAARSPAEIEHEVGDLLLACSRYAVKLGVEPEEALRGALRRFEGRFAAVEERILATGRALLDSSLEEMDRIWTEVKKDPAALPKK